jgi:hypothetical protein
MEIGHALPPSFGAVAAAWGESPAAQETAQVDANGPGHEPGERVDHGVEAAGVQTVARTPQQADEPKPVNETQVDTPLADVEFALPADLAQPVALVGLQVEAAAGWALPAHTFDPQLALARTSPRTDDEDDTRRRRAEPQADDDNDFTERDTDEGVEHAEAEEVVDEGPVPAEPWCEPLSLALRRALAASVTPQALLAAAEQWQRGRCVVLACPQGLDPAGPAWAFVLWPHARHTSPTPGVQRVAPALSLFGLRVDARLQWSVPPQASLWCHVRVVKEHHPRTGRQLVAVDGSTASKSGAPLPCEVQLGPVLARSLRRCDVCLRIPAAQRFWAALGAQWSAHVVVSSLPLIDADANTLEAATC